MEVSLRQRLLELARDVIAPLVEADGGELYIVQLSGDALDLHLGGTCSGCPGVTTTVRAVIEPAVKSVAPMIRLTVTNGAKLPLAARPVREWNDEAGQDSG